VTVRSSAPADDQAVTNDGAPAGSARRVRPIVGMNYYYATLHFVVTLGALVWLYVRRPHVYRQGRTVLVVVVR
jgi:hypothetical protein